MPKKTKDSVTIRETIKVGRQPRAQSAGGGTISIPSGRLPNPGDVIGIGGGAPMRDPPARPGFEGGHSGLKPDLHGGGLVPGAPPTSQGRRGGASSAPRRDRKDAVAMKSKDSMTAFEAREEHEANAVATEVVAQMLTGGPVGATPAAFPRPTGVGLATYAVTTDYPLAAVTQTTSGDRWFMLATYPAIDANAQGGEQMRFTSTAVDAAGAITWGGLPTAMTSPMEVAIAANCSAVAYEGGTTTIFDASAEMMRGGILYIGRVRINTGAFPQGLPTNVSVFTSDPETWTAIDFASQRPGSMVSAPWMYTVSPPPLRPVGATLTRWSLNDEFATVAVVHQSPLGTGSPIYSSLVFGRERAIFSGIPSTTISGPSAEQDTDAVQQVQFALKVVSEKSGFDMQNSAVGNGKVSGPGSVLGAVREALALYRENASWLPSAITTAARYLMPALLAKKATATDVARAARLPDLPIFSPALLAAHYSALAHKHPSPLVAYQLRRISGRPGVDQRAIDAHLQHYERTRDENPFYLPPDAPEYELAAVTAKAAAEKEKARIRVANTPDLTPQSYDFARELAVVLARTAREASRPPPPKPLSAADALAASDNQADWEEAHMSETAD